MTLTIAGYYLTGVGTIRRLKTAMNWSAKTNNPILTNDKVKMDVLPGKVKLPKLK